MFLTILTPTYNREKTLFRLYESLCKQNNKRFTWLVVDDGSTDCTRELIEEFIGEKKIDIKYILKSNGGKHTAVNTGLLEINTPLVFIVDSDDRIVEDAVETIFNIWKENKKNSSISSFWFLQKNEDDMIIGDKFKDDNFISNYLEVLINSEVKGDKKSVYLTDIRKQYLFPEFKNERFMGEGYIHKKIGENYEAVFINKPIYISEYLEDGLTKAGRQMRLGNPKGGIVISNEFLKGNVKLKVKIKKALLYTVYSLIDDRKIYKILKDANNRTLVTLLFPMSLLIYYKWKEK
ncbi:glycosyltransferase family 2 protein [Exiguobacterium sp. s129]|uniref:glycosyltransferase family 2 protein n=1 Tax=Exiguobacterium sp. s129 TaxID=2751264 RepID=UPI001BE51DF1|nr:glycosyltransferase family 2 protein [Exiguobacterium sp. s129]